MPAVPLREIVAFVRGQYRGPADLAVRGVAPLGEARADELSFLSDPRYARQLPTSGAGAILVAADLDGDDARFIRVPNPYLAAANVVSRWFGTRPAPSGVSPLASVSLTAKLGAKVAIGPFTTIGDNVVLGDSVVIYQNVAIEPDSIIGDESVIYPLVSVYHGSRIGKRCILHSGVVIGGDGYGFVTEGGRHHKIPQVGIVRIEDDVEIGAGTTIDRATFGETVIGEGTKIDNLVQIGHNVRIGKHCLLVSQVGIAGSTELGDSVVMAGQSGLSGHLKVGNGAQIGAKSAVFDNVPAGAKFVGNPAVPFRDYARREMLLKRMLAKKRKR